MARAYLRRPPWVTPIEWMLSEHRVEIDLATGCWLWTAGKTTAGYGTIRVDGATRYVHRLAYEFWNGPIPDGCEPDHLCRVTACFNPDHLEAVTRGENTGRGLRGTRRVFCPEGHAVTGGNAYICRGTVRRCRICWNAYQRERSKTKASRDRRNASQRRRRAARRATAKV